MSEHAPSALSPTLAHASKRQHDFIFTGSGAEYFRIWIVNLALSILTLGIYSAWATVRTRKYFYGNTHLVGASFEYLASPVAILKGRLVAVALFAAYIIVSEYYPLFSPLLVIIIALVVPVLVVRSLAFRAQNSSYRGVRFDFKGDVENSYACYLGWPMLIFLTLGLIYPFVVFKKVQFSASNHRFGAEKFSFSARVGQYYKLYLLVVLLFLAASAGVGVFLFALEGGVGDMDTNNGLLTGGLMMFVYIPALFVVAFIQARKMNILYNHSKVGDDFSFIANYSALGLFWIQVSNYVGIILTLGLFYPWAKVRMANYRAQHLSLVAETDLDQFVDQQVSSTTATGDEVGDIFSVDVGI